MSQKLTVRSPDVDRLRNEGFNVQLVAGFMLVHEIPYVTSNRVVKRGTLAMKLVLAGDVVAKPEDHVAYFVGEHPCNADGSPIEGLRNSSAPPAIAQGVTANFTFSARPKTPFESYHAKVLNYHAILSAPAKTIEPGASGRTFTPQIPDECDNSVFNYHDTASTRAEIQAISAKLALEHVAIVGLGGTGSYVLDLVAKTHVRKIHLFDGDSFFTHNAFRAPGAASLEELRTKSRKVEYLAEIYGKMHRGIVVHPHHLDSTNVDLLRPMQFVFVCMDDAPAKKAIFDSLHEWSIPFVDVGMGIYVGEGGLGGTLRVTASTPAKRDHVPTRISLAEGRGENEYAKNIQVADLNALNAALAVIRWKKLFGFYMDYEREHHSTYGIEVHLLTRDEKLHET